MEATDVFPHRDVPSLITGLTHSQVSDEAVTTTSSGNETISSLNDRDLNFAFINASRQLSASRDYLATAWRLRKRGDMGAALYIEARYQTLQVIRRVRQTMRWIEAQQTNVPRMTWTWGAGDFVERYSAAAFGDDE